MPVQQTFAASRNATWAPTLIYQYRGRPLPLAGARIDMQLRLYPGQPGNAMLTIRNVPFTDKLVGGTGNSEDDLRELTLEPSVKPGAVDGSEPNTLRSLPGLQTPEPGDPQTFAFDILITYADGQSERLAGGSFIADPGVTIA
ncbi:hypothetical protein [Sphingomonas sp. ACRSK]|uniref:hypothetical protein n=1 Tax=Sphingomonas sp. ACRSK TaxID=2918213 RepID=UPI001EF589E0|nr:hypothetical protein [Sphingomonas sp. ACRSK]MCG7350018.1 hypothetical protein [Sphingomonas sp. ACRSK]